MNKPLRHGLLWLSLILLGIVLFLRISNFSNKIQAIPAGPKATSKTQTTLPSSSSQPEPEAKFPPYVLNTLAYIQEHQQAPDGFVGGRIFQNREKQLPLRTTDGQKINYREWDVHPQRPGTNRGPERIVTGDDGSAWYTADHYRSFALIGAP